MLEVNKIHQGDCLELMKEIHTGSIDMILCDLPYGTTRNKWDSIIDLDLMWEQYNRITKDNGAIVLFAQTPFDKVLGYSNLKLLKYEWIWNKRAATGHLNAKKMPMKIHENILIFYKKPPTYNPIFSEGKPYKKGIDVGGSSNYGKQRPVLQRDYEGKRYPVSIIENSNANRKDRFHPTQKPVSLMEYLIKTYTNEGDVVLDNCIGSGTTAVAAMNTKRSFIGIEMEQKYVDIANERIRLLGSD